MDLPSTSETGIAQERVALPSMCTVQAPHEAMPQPNLVPVSLMGSGSTQRSGVLPATPNSLRCPWTVNAAMRVSLVPTDAFSGAERAADQFGRYRRLAQPHAGKRGNGIAAGARHERHAVLPG